MLLKRPRVAILDEPTSGLDPQSTHELLDLIERSGTKRIVIDSLPDDYRAALVLHDLEGLSVEQTAEICGCSLPTAKIRTHRARHRLRKALQQQCDFYRDADDVLQCDRKP